MAVVRPRLRPTTTACLASVTKPSHLVSFLLGMAVSFWFLSVWSCPSVYSSIGSVLEDLPPLAASPPMEANNNNNNDNNNNDNNKKKSKFFYTRNLTDYRGPTTVYQKRTFLSLDDETMPVVFPCYPGEKQLMLETPAHEGLLLQRPTKTGSTTITGIIMRLAHNRVPPNARNYTVCKHRTNHGYGRSYEYHKRHKSKSFLLTIIRDPTARAISQFFHFSVTVGQQVPTDKIFQKNLMGHGWNPVLREINLRSNKDENNTNNNNKKGGPYELPRHLQPALNFNYTPVVEGVLQDYDLIAVMERMDDSLVVMQHLLGLETHEIVYFRARSSGAFSNGPKQRPCVYITPSFVTSGMDRFFRTAPEWRGRTVGDELLYKAAHHSLDRTIDEMGRERFQLLKDKLQRAVRYAKEQCKGGNKVIPMCTESGEERRKPNSTCYIWMEGCDHQCLNSITYPPDLR